MLKCAGHVTQMGKEKEIKKCIHAFGGKISYKASTVKTGKMIA
jgi:hypothetical protein